MSWYWVSLVSWRSGGGFLFLFLFLGFLTIFCKHGRNTPWKNSNEAMCLYTNELGGFLSMSPAVGNTDLVRQTGREGSSGGNEARQVEERLWAISTRVAPHRDGRTDVDLISSSRTTRTPTSPNPGPRVKSSRYPPPAHYHDKRQGRGAHFFKP